MHGRALCDASGSSQTASLPLGAMPERIYHWPLQFSSPKRKLKEVKRLIDRPIMSYLVGVRGPAASKRLI